MSEDVGNVVENQGVEVTQDPVAEIPAVADPAEQGTELYTVAATTEEAKEKNFVPYDRFKAVIDQRNSAQTALEDRQRLLDYYSSVGQNQRQQFQPEPSQAYEEELDDPVEIAKRAQSETQCLRAEIEAGRQAEVIRSEIGGAVNELGFTDPNRAYEQIQQHLGAALHRTGKLLDVREMARHLRQKEIDYEKSIISRYKTQKTGDAVRAAAPTPTSPPVLEKQPEKAKGWNDVSKRITQRIRGG